MVRVVQSKNFHQYGIARNNREKTRTMLGRNNMKCGAGMIGEGGPLHDLLIRAQRALKFGPAICISYGRPGVAMPMGALGAVENVGGVVGANTPPVPILKPATVVEPELAT